MGRVPIGKNLCFNYAQTVNIVIKTFHPLRLMLGYALMNVPFVPRVSRIYSTTSAPTVVVALFPDLSAQQLPAVQE